MHDHWDFHNYIQCRRLKDLFQGVRSLRSLRPRCSSSNSIETGIKPLQEGSTAERSHLTPYTRLPSVSLGDRCTPVLSRVFPGTGVATKPRLSSSNGSRRRLFEGGGHRADAALYCFPPLSARTKWSVAPPVRA
jgi:hypothetical protein